MSNFSRRIFPCKTSRINLAMFLIVLCVFFLRKDEQTLEKDSLFKRRLRLVNALLQRVKPL